MIGDLHRGPQFAKPHTPADVPCLSNELPHSAWKVSLLRAPITGATVMAKRGYAQLENAITRPSCRAFLFLTFIKSPRRCGMNCSTAAQSKDGG